MPFLLARAKTGGENAGAWARSVSAGAGEGGRARETRETRRRTRSVSGGVTAALLLSDAVLTRSGGALLIG